MDFNTPTCGAMTLLVRRGNSKKTSSNSRLKSGELDSLNLQKIKYLLTGDKHFNPMLQSDRKLSVPLLKAQEVGDLIESTVKNGFCQTLIQNDDVVAVILAEKSLFDTQHFGFGVGRIKHLSVSEHLTNMQAQQAIGTLIELSENWMKQRNVKNIIARVDLDDANGILAFERNGFTIFDVLTTFNVHSNHVSVDNKHAPRNLNARPALAADEPKLMEIARETFRNDHFHRDHRFPKERSDELFAEWIYNCCHGLADAVLVAKNRQMQPVGFITCRKKHGGKNGYGVIDLVAVSPLHQNKGIGKLLVREACRWFSKNGVDSIFVGTQVTNLAAVRMYEDSGFRLASTEVTFHEWLGD